MNFDRVRDTSWRSVASSFPPRRKKFGKRAIARAAAKGSDSRNRESRASSPSGSSLYTRFGVPNAAFGRHIRRHWIPSVYCHELTSITCLDLPTRDSVYVRLAIVSPAWRETDVPFRLRELERRRSQATWIRMTFLWESATYEYNHCSRRRGRISSR